MRNRSGAGDAERVAVQGTVKEPADILEATDLEEPQGLQIVWPILDQAHGQRARERLDEAYAA